MNLDKETIKHMNIRLSVHAEERKLSFPVCDLQEIRRVLNSPEFLRDMQRMVNKAEKELPK